MPETSFVFVMIYFYLLIITNSHADNYTITGCSSDGYIDVREDTGTTIMCDGIQGQNTGIYWALSGIRIGDCGYPTKFDNCSLTDPNNTDYRLSRPSISTSELRILGNFLSKAGQNLTCARKNNATKVSCVINIISVETPQATNTDAIAGGVGALIAVVIVAVIVLVIVWRRRRDLENPRVSKGSKQTRNRQDNQHANNQIPSAPASKRSEHVQNTEGAMYPNDGSTEAADGNGGTSQEDVYAVVDKSKKTPQQNNDVTSLNSTDQTNDPSPRGTVHAHVLSSSEPRDINVASTLEGCHTKLHHDAKRDEPAVAADPTANVKLGQRQTAVSEAPTQQDTTTNKPTANAMQAARAKPNVKPQNVQNTSLALSEAPSGKEEERIHNRKTRSTKQNYENVGDSVSQAPLQAQRDSAETTGDEYNKLNVLNPQGQRRQEPNPDYSHLGSL